MLRRSKSVGLRVVREVASLPLRVLGMSQRGLALQQLTTSMVSEVNLPDHCIS